MPYTDKIFDDLEGYRRSAILASSIQLGIFDMVAKENHTVEELTRAIKSPIRSTRIILDALVAMEYLEKIDGKYYLTSISSNYLVRGKPKFLNAVAEFMVHPTMWEAMGQLSKAIKKGTTTLSQDAETPKHYYWKDFAQNTFWNSKPTANAIGDLINIEKLKGAINVLDIACGSGIYGMTLANRNVQVQLVCADWPEVLTITKQNARESNLDKRVDYIPGDIFKTNLRNSFDIAIASFIFHNFDHDKCFTLAKRIFKVLKPSGFLILHEYIPDEKRSERYDPLLFAVLMLALTKGGDTYTFSQYQTILRKAGFHKFSLFDLETVGESSIIIAQKT